MSRWNGATDKDNTAAALALLTLEPLLDFRHEDEEADLTASLREAAAYLEQHFGRLDPPYGELNRLRRGNKEWPIDGGPDIVRHP